ncbi:MAG: DEAD/DEAH box helicase [Desulfovibrio sp.]|jgi:non-specific serine/threonine protein kinase|nr:DEAD/DEAH box helicase [Desulfovibrio sp.]
MTRIVLTPQGSLLWRADAASASLAPKDGQDWRKNLFALGAGNGAGDGAGPERPPEDAGVFRFWRSFAQTFIFGLCRLPVDDETASSFALPPPSRSQLDAWLESAPPMQGGEYLSQQSLENIWSKLADWCAREIADSGGTGAFLQKFAPGWRRVGRVTIHLAENKNSAGLPFAFMATYTVGLNSEGRPVHQILGEALKRYARESDKLTLVSLLSPVRAASEILPWVKDLVGSGGIYRPQAFSISQAHRLLIDVPQLEQCGLAVNIPDWWQKRPKARVRVNIGETSAPALGLQGLLDWNVGLALGDQALSKEEIKALFAAGDGLVLFKGQWIEADQHKLREALEHWESARKASEGGSLTFAQAMRLLAGLPMDMRAEEGEGTAVHWPHVEAGAALRKLLGKVRQADASCPAPASLRAKLRPYQQKGLSWLSLLSGLGLGACLADDMGLGKTMQTLALLLLDKERSIAGDTPPPSLLVVPASLLGNWRAEAERFAPSLRLHFFHPSENGREQIDRWTNCPDDLRKADLVVTSYTMLARNSEVFSARPWRLVIADEAQNIKNSGTRQSRALKKIPAHARIALTGTPVENRLSDLWSLFDFINAGLLGSAKDFKAVVNTLEKRQEDQYGPLRRLVGPYILRRLKTDKRIIDDLPDKVESVAYCNLTPGQAKLYAQLVEQLRNDLERLAREEDGQFKRRGLVLQSIMRLKQVCNHPAQLTGEPDWNAVKSGKFERVGELCREMAERQDRVLVFTQFKEIIDPLLRHLEEIFGRPGLALHGGINVKQRKGLVDAFQRDDGPPFFILSLKAGGTGLNLTAAGQVIHFDRWWNPAVEDQATDRAFRIGQKKNVLVHKCVTRGTLEERIDAMLRQKRGLAGEILGKGDEINLTNLDDGALLDLLRLDISRAVL